MSQTMKLNRELGPFHTQISRQLRQKISSGEKSPGELLTSESELMKEYGVSRAVARQVMNTLEAEGMIVRLPGKGTFVRDLVPDLFGGAPIESAESLIKQGAENKLTTIKRAVVQADADVVRALNLSEGEEVALRVGVRTFGDLPFAYQREHALLEIGRKMLEAEQVQSMLLNFQTTSGVQIGFMTQAVSAIGATEDVAAHLGVEVGFPVLQIDWTIISQEGKPVVFARSRYRSDRYRHVNKVPVMASQNAL